MLHTVFVTRFHEPCYCHHSHLYFLSTCTPTRVQYIKPLKLIRKLLYLPHLHTSKALLSLDRRHSQLTTRISYIRVLRQPHHGRMYADRYGRHHSWHGGQLREMNGRNRPSPLLESRSRLIHLCNDIDSRYPRCTRRNWVLIFRHREHRVHHRGQLLQGPWHVRPAGLWCPLRDRGSLSQVRLDLHQHLGRPDQRCVFPFLYGNGAYSIRNNGCVCNSMSGPFNAATEGCRCAFPVNGQFEKRKIDFEA